MNRRCRWTGWVIVSACALVAVAGAMTLDQLWPDWNAPVGNSAVAEQSHGSSAWRRPGSQRRLGSGLPLGARAPDFALLPVAPAAGDEPLSLASLKKGRPVVLVFGGFT
jgi:hypothetical protein